MKIQDLNMEFSRRLGNSLKQRGTGVGNLGNQKGGKEGFLLCIVENSS
jgi:hypothetical protein